MKDFRLNKQHRNDFINAIIGDIPQSDGIDEAQKYLKAYALTVMPPKVSAVYNDEQTRGYLMTTPFHISAEVGDWRYHRSFHAYLPGNYRLPAHVIATMEAHVRHFYQRIQDTDELRRTLSAAVANCNDYAALERWAGDKFAKYLKAITLPDKPATNLPVSATFYEKLHTLGFPKGSAPQQVADTKADRRTAKRVRKGSK